MTNVAESETSYCAKFIQIQKSDLLELERVLSPFNFKMSDFIKSVHSETVRSEVFVSRFASTKEKDVLRGCMANGLLKTLSLNIYTMKV